MSFDWLRHVRQGLLSVTHSSSLTRPRVRRGELPSDIPAIVQRLEPRVLLSVTPVGFEFQVNTVTGGAQRTYPESPQAVAMDADGDFVVTWASNFQDGNGYGVYARRYSAAGVSQGGEFRVNTFTTSDQRNSTVAMDADGDFVVTWSSAGQDSSGLGIYAQRYNAAGVAQGSEFRVNTFTTGNQQFSTVAMDADGDFAVTWSSANQDGDSYGIYCQRYNAAGVAQGSEFRINSFTTGLQWKSAVAMDADGDFVATWTSSGQDGGVSGVYAQRYNAAGITQGSEFRVNTYTTSSQLDPTVAMDPGGDFVVTWFSSEQDGSFYGVYAQQYNATGIIQGGEFRVNSFTTSNQMDSRVAMDADGDFVVTWTDLSGQDGGGGGTYAQRYKAGGITQGSEFRVNSVTMGSQRWPALAMDADGDFVVVWSSLGQDGSDNGVYAQRFDDIGPNDFDNAGPTVTDFLVAGDKVLANEQLVVPPTSVTVIFSEKLSTVGGPSGATSVHNPANWRLTKNGVDVSNLISGISFGLESTTGKYEAVVYFTSPLTVADYVLTAKGTATITDVSGNALDGNADGTPDDDYTRAFRVRAPQAIGNEFRVNTFTTGTQRTLPESPRSVAMDADGDFVVTWVSYNQDGSGIGVYAQRYNAVGVAQGSEFRVNSYTTSNQLFSTVAMDSDGDFVIVWGSAGQDGSSGGIYAQRYNALGVAQGIEFRVNTVTTGNQVFSTVAMDSDGDFVVAWSSPDGSGYGVYAQRFNAAGVAQGIEFRVNTHTAGNQRYSTVALDADGDFVVAWSSFAQDGSDYGVYARRYNAAGVAQGGEFRVNGFLAGNQSLSTIAMDADGDFVVTWSSVGQDGSDYGVYAKRYNAADVAQGGEFRVNTFTTSNQRRSTVAMDADGDFVISWSSYGQDGSAIGVYAQRYSAAGIAQGSEFRVNIFTSGVQTASSVAMDADGDFVVAWSSFVQDNSSYGVYAQRYIGGTTPTAFDIAPVINEDTPLIGGLLWAFDPETPIDQLIYTITTPATHGTATKTGIRSFNYTPHTDFNGVDSFQFTVSDGQFTSLPATVSITVNPVAGVPQAFDATASTSVDTALNGGLMWGYDNETSMNNLTYSITTLTGHGTVAKTGVRGFNYVPAANFSGVDSFLYTVSDGQHTSAPATMTIDVMPASSLPIAFDITPSPPASRRARKSMLLVPWPWLEIH